MANISETKPVTHLPQQEFDRPPESPLTLQHSALLFFHSYDHGQGSPPIQRYIFNLIHSIRPNWTFDDKFRDEDLRPVALKMISRFLGNGKSHMPISESKPIEEDIDARLRDFQTALNPPDNDSSRQVPNTVLSIVKGMIELDFDNLITKGGRPYNRDPWQSYTCYYGLLGNTTKIPEFDIMYRMARHFVRTPGQMSQMRETDAQLDTVISKFLEKHPNIPSVW